MKDTIPPANLLEIPSKGKADPPGNSHRKEQRTHPFSTGFLALLSLLGMQRTPGSRPEPGRGNEVGAVPDTSPRTPAAPPAEGRLAPAPLGRNGSVPAGPPKARKASGPASGIPRPSQESGKHAGSDAVPPPRGTSVGAADPAEARKKTPQGGRRIAAPSASSVPPTADIPTAKGASSVNPSPEMGAPERLLPSSRHVKAVLRHPSSVAPSDREAATAPPGPSRRSLPASPSTGTTGAGGDFGIQKPGAALPEAGRKTAPGDARRPERPGGRIARGETPVPLVGKATTPALPETVGSRSPDPLPAKPPEMPSLADQFVARLSSLPDGSHRVTLRLVPDHLGTLKIDLWIQHGTLDARLQVESPEARAALLRDEPALRQALLSGGITLSSYTVSVAAGGGAMDRGSHPAGRGGERRHSGEGSGERHRSAETGDGSAYPVDPALSETHWIA